jgi:hypothetical protein
LKNNSKETNNSKEINRGCCRLLGWVYGPSDSCPPLFLRWSLLSAVQAKRAPGTLRVTGLGDSNLTFWTLTVWSNEQSMRAFMLSGPHKRAMPKLVKWCDEASVVHWHQETAEPPSWSEAHRRKLDLSRRKGALRIKDAIEAFMRFTDKPMVSSRDAVINGLVQACMDGLVGIGRGGSLSTLQARYCKQPVVLDPNEDGLWIIPPFTAEAPKQDTAGLSKDSSTAAGPVWAMLAIR